MAEAKVDTEKLKVLTTEFRASHPHLMEPTEVVRGDGKFKYSCEMLFDKKITDLTHLQAPIKAAIIGKWGPDKADWPVPLRMPLRDGDKPYGKKKELKPEHKGMWVVRASTDAKFGKPYVVGRDPNVHLTEASQFYPGCYGRAALKAFAYDEGGNEGVKFVLDGVQFIRDGVAMGGKKPANQVFGVIEGDDGDTDISALGGGDEPEDEVSSFM